VASPTSNREERKPAACGKRAVAYTGSGSGSGSGPGGSGIGSVAAHHTHNTVPHEQRSQAHSVTPEATLNGKAPINKQARHIHPRHQHTTDHQRSCVLGRMPLRSTNANEFLLAILVGRGPYSPLQRRERTRKPTSSQHTHMHGHAHRRSQRQVAQVDSSKTARSNLDMRKQAT
jgi:hypothetical protein